MREISSDELKDLQLQILLSVHRFCQENSISYGLAYGSLIGCIRHHGYIPWDDDIDILMPRPDYDRFISIFNGKVPHLKVNSPELNSRYYAPYANVYDDRTLLVENSLRHKGGDIGVKIDVFPIDTVPADDEKYSALMLKSMRLNEVLRVKRQRLDSVKGNTLRLKHIVKLVLFSPFSYAFIQRRIMSMAGEFSFDGATYVDHLTYPCYQWKRFLKDDISSFIPKEFEHEMVMVPVGYDHYLKTIYGDYMKLPPEEKRIANHGFVAYWKD